MKIDMSGIEELARDFNPASLSDPAAIENLLGQGVFEPKATPAQTQALERLETLLALIEGWVQVVVTAALGERIPGAAALGETLRRRRASGGPAEQTFATLVGLELRPRKLREAAALWERLTQAVGADARDAIWQHPDLLPAADGSRRSRRLHRPGHRRGHQRSWTRRSPNSSGTADREDPAPAVLWITDRGSRPVRGTVSPHAARRAFPLCAEPGDAGAAATRRRGTGGLGSAPGRAGAPALRA